MDILLFILFLYLEAYSVFYVIFSVIKIARGKKVPGYLLITNGGIIAAFFFIRKMINDHELIFVGGYKEDPEHWETGMANAFSTIYNLVILFFIFWGTQIIFWIIFSIRYQKLNLEDKEYLQFPKK